MDIYECLNVLAQKIKGAVTRTKKKIIMHSLKYIFSLFYFCKAGVYDKSFGVLITVSIINMHQIRTISCCKKYKNHVEPSIEYSA